MRRTLGIRWLVVAVSAAMLLAVAAACSSETVEVPGETVIVEKEVIKEVQVPGETVVVEKEVVKTVEVPGETVVVDEGGRERGRGEDVRHGSHHRRGDDRAGVWWDNELILPPRLGD